MERQNNMFFTMWYGVYRPAAKQLAYAGGGHPPALLISKDSSGPDPIQSLESTGPLVGIDEDSEFPAEVCQAGPGDQLFIYSDGAFEISKPDGQMWSFHEFLSFMSRPPEPELSKMDCLLKHIRQLLDGDEFEDDFSIVQLCM